MAVTITHTTPADGTFSATGAAAWDANHAVSGLGTMAEQDANNVNITGGSITGVTGVLTGLTVNSTPTSGGAAGRIMFDTGSVLQESSNLVWDNTNKKLTITGATVTTSQPVLDMTQTWNAGAVTFTGLKFNVTDTASAAASLLMDLQVGGSSQTTINKSGILAAKGIAPVTGSTMSLGVNMAFTGASQLFFDFNTFFASTTAANSRALAGNGFTVGSAFGYNFSSTTGANGAADVLLTRRGAANLRFGAADAAAPVAQTLSVQSVVAGTSNTAGANLTITGSQGTGTGAGGSIIFQVAPAGSSGTAQNALATAWQITGAGHLLSGSDNTYDIGASNSLRPRNIFVRGIIYAGPSGLALSDASSSVLVYIQSNASGVSRLTNSSGNNFGRLCFGDYTSSFPALKRSTTILQVRLADDSAYAPVEASTVRTATAYTVATLPAAGTAGRRAYVTDATAPTFLGALIGGGTVVCPVFDDGTAWVAG